HLWLPFAEKEKAGEAATHILVEDAELVTGASIAQAYRGHDEFGKSEIHLEFDKEGKLKFADVTERNVGRRLAIVLDGVVQSAPRIDEPIPSGQARIRGKFTPDDASNLAIVLRSGKLPAPLEVVGEYYVGPTLGEESVRLGRIASIIALIVVMLMMVLYYRGAGLISCIALVMNLILIFGLLAFFGATITLPGIAGIVLTMGMAVDANIIIYERILDEKLRGKPLIKAFEAGFDRAFYAVFDANVTTFLAGIILYYVGIGPIQGFAVTLMIGILTTMFTAVLCTKIMMRMIITGGLMKEFSVMSLLRGARFGWLSISKLCMICSLVVCIASIALFGYAVSGGGSVLGIEFTGGSEVTMEFNKPVTADFVRGEIIKFTGDSPGATGPKYPDVEVQRVVSREEATSVGGALEKEAAKTYIVRAGSREEGGQSAAGGGTSSAPFVADLRRIFKGRISERPIEDMADATSDGAVWRRFGINLAAPAEEEEVRTRLRAWSTNSAAKEPHVKAVGDAKTSFEIRLAPEDAQKLPELQEYVEKNLDLARDPFKSVSVFGARVAADLKSRAFFALILSWIGIVLYLWVRFELRFGIAAVVALIHDVVITLGVLTLVDLLVPLSWGINFDIGMASVAAFLTIVGYSVNNTIVIFDRVRENLRELKKEPYPAIVELSINQTLIRSIMTSLTTLAAVVILFVVTARSGGSIATFTFPVMVGIIVGTYSSWLIAPPLTALRVASGRMMTGRIESAGGKGGGQSR
ncbi:MAG: protein translocase subunit SecD, partial [Planctomycetota bacterium]|nr:protein translocase subunit SecD [Planctomycetota bacterium]